MRNGVGVAVIVAAVVVLAFVVGATFFEPKHEGPLERAGQKVDKVLKQ